MYQDAYYKGFQEEPRFEKVRQVLASFHAEKVLDVGCGDGDVSVMIQNVLRAREIHGLEISASAVERACKKGIIAKVCDVENEKFPYPDGYFDLVYLGEIIEHVFDPEHLLEESHRVLCMGGKCIITTPNLAGWPNRVALLLGYQPYPMAASPRHESVGKLLIHEPQGQWGHIRVLTLGSLLRLVSLHCLTPEKVLGCPVTVKETSRIFKIIRLVDRLLSRNPSFATRVIVVARKLS